MKTLLLTHRVPFPPNRGDRIRAHHLVRFLSRRTEVYLGCLSEEKVSRAAREWLEARCERVEIADLGAWRARAAAAASLAAGGTATEGHFRSRSLARTVRRWARSVRFDNVLVYCSSMGQYVAATSELAATPVVLDLVDVDSQKWLGYAERSRGLAAWLYRTEGRRLRRLERALVGRARAVTLTSEAEKAVLGRFCPVERVVTVPQGVDLEYFRPAAEPMLEAAPRCVFVGHLGYRPNVDGVRWFCRNVWPEVMRRLPGARFDLVGLRPARGVRELAAVPGVELIGEVADVRPHLAAATMAVVPLPFAHGVQTKVLEAMAAGRPVVTSPAAIAGLRTEIGRHLELASTSEEWVEAVCALSRDAERRRRLAAAARGFVERHYSWAACLEPFARLLNLPTPPGFDTGTRASAESR